MAKPAGMEKFDHINSAEVVWRHAKTHPYGDGRKGARWDLPSFLGTLRGCFFELGMLCPLGHPTKIVSAGAYTPKAGRHGEGRAIDIDALWWTVTAGVMTSPRILVTRSYLKHPAFYLGVEAHFRRFFGIVLGWNYNADHKGHWHIDDGHPVRFVASSHMCTTFVQAALEHVWRLTFDKPAGKKAAAAAMREPLAEVLRDLRIDKPLTDAGAWQRFLLATSIQGMNMGVDTLVKSL